MSNLKKKNSFQAIEKFSANTTHIGQRLRSLCQHLQETEFPNNVAATEELIQKHEDERKQVRFNV